MKERDAHPDKGEKGKAERRETRMREKEMIGRFCPFMKGDFGGKRDGKRREFNRAENILF